MKNENLRNKKVALVSGISGQDGSYLADLLLGKGYEVHGIIRRVAIENDKERTSRINNLLDKIILHQGSLTNFENIYEIVDKVKPDECYHLGAQSFVANSFDDEFSTFNTNINGTHYLLHAIKEKAPKCRFYFAASSEMFGKVDSDLQNENTKFYPRSPYGISKVFGFDLTRNYREAYNMHASSGILFNHESPRRGMEFVTRKISSTIAKIKLGLENKLMLGNLDARRDWGFAKEYVEAMWLILQQEKPDDYVIATGETHTIREFVDLAFKEVGLDYKKFVFIDKKFYRPAEVNLLCGDYSKAKKVLGWKPKIKFKELVEIMVRSDLGYYSNRNK